MLSQIYSFLFPDEPSEKYISLINLENAYAER